MTGVPPPSGPRPGPAVVVVNYGTHALVESNLRRTVGEQFDGTVVVVDNFKDHDERRAVTEVCARRGWSLVTTDHNEGFGVGSNRGADLAIASGATELVMINPDAWMEPEHLARLHDTVVGDPWQLVAPRVVRPDGRLYAEENDLHLDEGAMLWSRLRPPATAPDRVHTWVSGACFATSARMWRAAGGFDPDYFLYWEDVDLCRRVQVAGGRVHVETSVVAVHEEGGSQRQGGSAPRKSALYFYYNARNRLLYAAKHLGEEDRRRWVRATPRASYGFVRQAGRRRFVRPDQSLWPAARGTWDGWRWLRRAPRVSD